MEGVDIYSDYCPANQPEINGDFQSMSIVEDYNSNDPQTTAFNNELKLTQEIQEAVIPSSIEHDPNNVCSRHLNKGKPLTEVKQKLGKGVSKILNGKQVVSSETPVSNGKTTTFVAHLKGDEKKTITVLQLDQISSYEELLDNALTNNPNENTLAHIQEAKNCSNFIFLQGGNLMVTDKRGVEKHVLDDSPKDHVFIPILTAKNN